MGKLFTQPRCHSVPFLIFKSKMFTFQINTAWKVSPISCTLLIRLIQAPGRAVERFLVSAGLWPGSKVLQPLWDHFTHEAEKTHSSWH